MFHVIPVDILDKNAIFKVSCLHVIYWNAYWWHEKQSIMAAINSIALFASSFALWNRLFCTFSPSMNHVLQF